MSAALVENAAEANDRVVAVDDDALYEEIDGVRVELPPMSFHASRTANRLLRKLGYHCDELRLGDVVGETLFTIPKRRGKPNLRRPDVAFVSVERWPTDRPDDATGNAWPVVPDFAVEVVSPSDLVSGLLKKIREYFVGGVRLVWVIDPLERLVVAYESLTRTRNFEYPEVVDAAPVLPDFRLPLDQLFLVEPTGVEDLPDDE